MKVMDYIDVEVKFQDRIEMIDANNLNILDNPANYRFKKAFGIGFMEYAQTGVYDLLYFHNGGFFSSNGIRNSVYLESLLESKNFEGNSNKLNEFKYYLGLYFAKTANSFSEDNRFSGVLTNRMLSDLNIHAYRLLSDSMSNLGFNVEDLYTLKELLNTAYEFREGEVERDFPFAGLDEEEVSFSELFTSSLRDVDLEDECRQVDKELNDLGDAIDLFDDMGTGFFPDRIKFDFDFFKFGSFFEIILGEQLKGVSNISFIEGELARQEKLSNMLYPKLISHRQ